MFTIQEFLRCLKKYLLDMALSNFKTKIPLNLSKFASCDAQKEFNSR